MEPLIAYNILESIQLLSRAMRTLEKRCINGITINEDRCREMVDNSIGIITALNPYIGYENSSRIAKEALEKNCSVVELISKEGLLKQQQIIEILNPRNMVLTEVS